MLNKFYYVGIDNPLNVVHLAKIKVCRRTLIPRDLRGDNEGDYGSPTEHKNGLAKFSELNHDGQLC